ncbi:hypothetical protein AK830_g7319 [Neonectria ditissima]|uniref:Uncharacterized protein n=1 Tax=Neonectria ditissima TaxID=78410 RepID=A0A0P7AZX1_9HYPO|nr:hypothetical protein AK830_g7319 [Neonectria ditissima]
MGMATLPHPDHQFSTFSYFISYFKLQSFCSGIILRYLAELVLIMPLGSEKMEFGVQPAPESNGKRWTRLSEREIASEGPQEMTALHRAVKQGQTQIVAKLVSRFGGAVDQGDIYDRTPLHYVAAQQHAGELTQTLLKNGANVDAVDSQNLTPLHVVAYTPKWGDEPDGKGRNSVAAQLVDNGAEVNTRDVFGDSPLHDAAKRGDKELMKLLLQHGADSECRNFDDQTPQEVLPQTKDKPDLERLLRSIRNWDPDTAHACRAIPSDPPQCWNSGPGGETDDPTNICRKFFASVRFFYREREYSQSWSVSIHDLLHHSRDNSTIQKREEEFFDLVQEKFEVDKDRIRDNCWKWIHIPVNQDLVWRLTDDLDESGTSSNPPEKRKDGWRFLERNLAQRKGANPGVYIRVPHKTQEDLEADQGQETDHAPEMDHESWKDTSTDTENTSPNLYQREIWRDSTHLLDDRKFSLVVPYIDFETEQYLQRFEKSKGSYKIKTPRIRDKCELEVVSRPYKGLMGLHKSQSLDESQYDMLSEEDLRKRDEDQVVFKWSKDNIKKPTFTKGRNVALPPRKNIGEGDDRNVSPDNLKFKTYLNEKGKEAEFGRDTRDASQLPRLLMVHQLWLWKLDKDTVITAFPDRYHRGVEDSLFDTIRQGGIDSYRSPHQLIEDILYESVTFLDEFRYAGLGIHVLDIFDSSIAKCSDEEAACFEAFRKKLGKDDRGPEQINPEIDLIRQFKDIRPEQINPEIALIRQCKDIRDELHLLLRVFEMQRNVVKRFADLVWSSQSEIKKVFIEDCGVGYLIERTKSLDRHAQRTLQELDYLVQTEQAQISLEEAHSAGQLNKIIWLFTLITVIFERGWLWGAAATITVSIFIFNYGIIALAAAVGLGWKIAKRAPFHRGKDVDLVLGLEFFDALTERYRQEREAAPVTVKDKIVAKMF